MPRQIAAFWVVVLAMGAATVWAQDFRAQQIAQAKERSEVFDLSRLTPGVHSMAAKVIAERFGINDELAFWELLPVEYGAADARWQRAYGWRLEQGRAVFEQRCAACHGDDGNGNGERADKLAIRPRDFRWGFFKWKSTYAIRPSRHDLRETLWHGLPGTAMESFRELPTADAEAAVEYVRWLAMRGQVSYAVFFEARDFEDDDEDLAEILREVRDDFGARIAGQWADAELETNLVRPTKQQPVADEASIGRGKAHFHTRTYGCFLCHGENGNGEASYKSVDYWGRPEPLEDLSAGVYRGGSSPLDLFTRMAGGIHGTSMPQFLVPQRPSDVVNEDGIWEVVNYLISIRSDQARAAQAVHRRPPPQGDAKLTLPKPVKPQPSEPTGDAALPIGKPAGWGTLRGQFVCEGKPVLKPLTVVGGDRRVFGNELPNLSLRVGSTGGLRDVVVYLRDQDAPVHPDLALGENSKVVLESRNGAYLPRVLFVRVGQSLELANADVVANNFKAILKRNAFNVTLPAGGRHSVKMLQAETSVLPVTDSIHPWKRANLLVLPHPYAAVTDEDGRFEIKLLPAGEWTIQCWHERTETSIGPPGNIRGRMRVVIRPDSVTDLGKVAVPVESLR